jgi:hypothetical protein
MPNAWITEHEHVQHAHFGGHATVLVSAPVEMHETHAVVSWVHRRWHLAALQRGAEEMMLGLGGVRAPDADLRRGLAELRDQSRRRVAPVRRRAGPARLPEVP